jgi:nicotinate-nucleotide adenylyltransferase
MLQLADIVIARRINAAAVDYPFPHTVIDNEVMNISSNTIRQKIADGSDWRCLVPCETRAIIEDRGLYGLRPSTAPPAGDDCSAAVILHVEAAARESLSTIRFLHSRNTAILAQDICRRFGLDPIAGYLAGIAHDLGKQLDAKQLMKLVKSDGKAISSLEKSKPNLLHGRAAAVLLRERFCIHNKDILEAVAFHTSGNENMGPLAKVIYIADKVEVSRNIDPALRRMCYEENLDSIFYAVLKKTISKLQSKDLDLSEETLKLLKKMKGKDV